VIALYIQVEAMKPASTMDAKETGRASGATGYLAEKEVVGCSLFGRPSARGKGGEKMKKRVALVVTALLLALSMSMGAASVAFGDPDCAPPKKPPCHDPGGSPEPGDFVGPGGESKTANHH